MRALRTFTAATAALALVPPSASAETVAQARDTGVSGIWMVANLSYAGMRAQDSASNGWRIVAFICGFPGTLLTYLVVTEGSERAYGVELPRAPRAGAP